MASEGVDGEEQRGVGRGRAGERSEEAVQVDFEAALVSVGKEEVDAVVE